MLLYALFAAVLLALLGNSIARARRDAWLRSQMRDQHQETEHFLNAWRELEQRFDGFESYGAGPQDWAMTAGLSMTQDGEKRYVVHFAVSCELRDGKLAPLEIKDFGGERNGEFLPALAETYKKKGWEYVIRRMTAPNENP